MPNKWVFIVLALLFGGLGIHKLYEGKVFMFLLYLMFCWTFIPVILSLFEALIALFCWE